MGNLRGITAGGGCIADENRSEQESNAGIIRRSRTRFIDKTVGKVASDKNDRGGPISQKHETGSNVVVSSSGQKAADFEEAVQLEV